MTAGASRPLLSRHRPPLLLLPACSQLIWGRCAARGLGAVHRLGRVQGAHGARGQGHHALLPVHDRRAAAHHLYPGHQPVHSQALRLCSQRDPRLVLRVS